MPIGPNLTNIEIDEILMDLDLNGANQHNKTVLIIDDDQWIQRVVSHHLKNWGFDTVSAFDAVEGIASAAKIMPRFILLDIIMPEANGDLVLKILKKIEYTSNIPVIIMSGNLNVSVIGSTYKNGAAGFISKPIKEITLLRKIKEILVPDTLLDPRLDKPVG